MNDIQRQYEEFSRTPFPNGLGGEEVNGVELVLIDAEAAGIIENFIQSKTGISPDQYEALLAVQRDLNTVMDDLPQRGRLYFQTLHDLVERVLLKSRENKE